MGANSLSKEERLTCAVQKVDALLFRNSDRWLIKSGQLRSCVCFCM